MLYTGSDHKNKQHQFKLEQLLSTITSMIENFVSQNIDFGVVLTTTNNIANVTIPPYYSVDTISVQVLNNDGTITLIAQNTTDNENIMNININNTSDVISYTNYITPNVPQPYNVQLTLIPDTGNNHKLAIKLFCKKRM